MTLAAADPVGPKRWTVEEFEQLGEAGAFSNGRVELIEGEIVEMPPQRAPHAYAIIRASALLQRVFGNGFTVRCQVPIVLAEVSELEPDLAVVAGDPLARVPLEHPGSALLIVDISESTLTYDRTRKANLYAKAGVPEYWIVNLVDRVLEVRSDPSAGVFKSVRVLRPGESVSPLAAPAASLAVVDFLP